MSKLKIKPEFNLIAHSKLIHFEVPTWLIDERNCTIENVAYKTADVTAGDLNFTIFDACLIENSLSLSKEKRKI